MPGKATSVELLNVSYDPTRELWSELNKAFIPEYEKETGVKVTIKQSHGSSGTQAQAVVNGLESTTSVNAADLLQRYNLASKFHVQHLPPR